MTVFGLGDLAFVGATSGVAYDADALAYITAVEAADGQALETAVKDAINAFVVGCKTDATWNAIKASCILAGARTLAGALVPLVGVAPTNNNFVSGDYNRKTGLVGNGTTKYINTNRNNSDDPVDNQHASAFRTNTVASEDAFLIAARGIGDTSSTSIGNSPSGLAFRSRTANGSSATPANPFASGFFGVRRSASSSFQARAFSTTYSYSVVSTSPATSRNFGVFGNAQGTVLTTSRIAFYSIGESLDLALLDARVTTLINAIAAAIP